MAYKRPSPHYPDLPPSYETSVGPAAAGESIQKEGPPHLQEYQQETVVVQYLPAPNFGQHSVKMTCPYCQALVWTRTKSEGPGPMAWLIGGLLCVLGFGLCACIPCCIDSLDTVVHSCPNCRQFLGKYSGGDI